MTDSPKTDRRTSANAPLTALVNLAITFRRTLGERMARHYFGASAIPGHIAERVLRDPEQRRMTDWECVRPDTGVPGDAHAMAAAPDDKPNP